MLFGGVSLIILTYRGSGQKKTKFLKIHNWSCKISKGTKIVKTNFGKVSKSKKITS